MLDFDNMFGIITAYCDEEGCKTEEDFDNGEPGYCNLSGTLDEMKNGGWKISRKDGDWFHSCPNHREDK
jgi:hypothetical protein